jgi:hypothetical protein
MRPSEAVPDPRIAELVAIVVPSIPVVGVKNPPIARAGAEARRYGGYRVTDEPMFHPYPHTLGTLFRDQWPMYTDEYQRDFAWEADEVADFINDIARLHEKRQGGNEHQYHFFGAVVAIEHRRLPLYDRPNFEIVDGQQRLTTFSLAIAAVLDRAKELRNQLSDDNLIAFLDRFVDDTRKGFLWQEETHKLTFEPRSPRLFEVTDRDSSAFHQILDLAAPEEPQDDDRFSVKLLLEAYDTIRRGLVGRFTTAVEPADAVTQLVEFTRSMTDGSEFVFISTESRTRATQLFSVLNDRGRSLEEADLLRTYNVMLAELGEDRFKIQVKERWDAIDASPRLTVDSFLRHHYASWTGVRVSSNHVFRQYRSVFFQDREEPFPSDEGERAAAFAISLGDSMRLYEPISRGAWPFAGSDDPGGPTEWDKDRLHRLVRALASERSLPLLLSAATRGEPFFLEMVLVLERLEFRALVAGVEQNAMANMYFDIAALVRWKHFDADLAIAEIERWLALWADDNHFEDGLSERLVYGSYRSNNYIKHLLTTIDDCLPSFDRGEPPRPPRTKSWDFSELQIEHIFPQSPKGGLPAAMEGEVHRLGNLTFWGPRDNRDASNLLPTDSAKISAYETSEVESTKRVGSIIHAASRWDPPDVQSRETEIVARAKAIFALTQGTEPPPSRRRRSMFQLQEPGTRQVWLVSSKPDSGYDDVPNVHYHYPSRIPNGQRIASGDVLILFRPQEGRGSRRTPARAFGIACVGQIEFALDGSRRAIYSGYVALDEVPISDALGGLEPRENRRNAINKVGEEYLAAVLAIAGVEAPCSPPDTGEDVREPVADPANP